MGAETCKCGGCRMLRQKTEKPKVGALVSVAFVGEVESTAGDGFRVRGSSDVGLPAMSVWSAWVPSSASVEVIKPARPREVLLLECGHVTDMQPSPSGEIYCWRSPCHKAVRIERTGSVTW